ncbi:MAG: NYN domain-containing protein [Desulfovermiculus sp.]|nr:NYN domain-containing protein [Desulfovermiculus sp.]
MSRVAFLIDGFNLYHSVREAQRELNASTKWLNIKGLCQSYIYLLGKEATLFQVYYFSALAKHLEATNPDVTQRHQDFIECIKDTGVQVELNRFKKNSVKCKYCNRKFFRHEEKETDVSIAIKLLEIFINDECDIAVLVTGDTDLSPAVKTAKRLFPNKKIGFAFPYKRKNKELAKLADYQFEIKKQVYAKFQFSDPFITQEGIAINKPVSW